MSATSKVPTLANWSRDTTIRLAAKLFWLAKRKPEEFEVLGTVLIGKFLSDIRESEERISKKSTENVDLYLKASELEEKIEELEEKLKSLLP